MIKRFFPNLALVVLAVIVVLFSGCRVDFGTYRLSGRVTTIDGKEGIPGVTVEYEIVHGKRGYDLTDEYGYWEIWANKNQRVRIWAHLNNYIFGPGYDITVREEVTGLNFKLIGLTEDFSDESSGWDKVNYADGSYQDYDLGEYVIMVQNSDGIYDESISAPSPLRVRVPHSYTVEVTAYNDYWSKPGGESGTLGLVFNIKELNKIGEFYYVFRIRPDIRQAEYLKVIREEGGINVEVCGTKTTSRIKQDEENYLKVIQNGNRATLFVNGKEIWENIPVEQQDCEFIRAGLYACADKGYTFTARFDDFKLYSIGYAPQPQFMGIQSHEIKSHKGIEVRK